MVIDGTKKFACRHEFVTSNGKLLCYKCDHLRDEPAKGGPATLAFFPVPVPEVLTIGWLERPLREAKSLDVAE